tara:strand:- start:44176 stop:44493 length:318 start_codon:yes stop_codon:yes gene_type:complete
MGILLEGKSKGVLIESRYLKDSNPKQKEYTIKWYIFKDPDDGEIRFRVKNGVTGFECWRLSTLLKSPQNEKFMVCCGTPNRWDQLYMLDSEWQFIVNKYMRQYDN